ncbi:MAG: DNA sulfur modification protein DndB [Sulfuricaulis sp.]|nr:DNA sulfur modification protein DndB [Sulfuricaulis sp.]
MSGEIAVTDAPKKKGGAPVSARPQSQDVTMLKVAERPVEGKADVSKFVGFSEDHRAAMWLDEEVKKTRKGVTTQVVELTPALARVLLERNDANRKLSPFFIDAYARDMEHGAWRFNGEPVIISDDGKLNDGQHRCAAVIEANTAITVPLVIGVSRDTRTTLDQGRIRTAGDYLAMEGHIDPNVLAAASSYIWQWQTRGVLSGGGKAKPTKSELLELVDKHPDIAGSVAAIPRKGAPAAGGHSLLAFCHWAFSVAAPKSDVDMFMVSLTGGASLLSRDPILYVRNRLITERGRLRLNDKAELIFRGWNAHRKGESVSRIPIIGSVLPVVES